jgi:hypothetical protein
MTGIQIHGPLDTHWIYPQDFYVVGSDIPGGKKNLNEDSYWRINESYHP